MPTATSTIWMPRRTSAAGIIRESCRFRGKEWWPVLLRIFFEQVLIAVQGLDAIDHRNVAPFEKSLVGGFNGAIHVLRRRIGNLGDDFAAGWIDDVVQILVAIPICHQSGNLRRRFLFR